jgi:cytochrome c biogenesis factor
VFRDGRRDGVLQPGQRQYDTGQVGNEVDIRSRLATGTDLYSILQGVDRGGGGGVTVKVLVNPAVGLVWLAGFVFALGALITLWPDPREARQLARRYGELLARSEA